MVKPKLTPFESLAPIIIQRYERYLPTAFDESMSLLQKMNKIIQFLESVGKLTEEMGERWNSVMEWVMNDGLNDAVIVKLNRMVLDGTLASLINEDLLGSKSTIVVSETEPSGSDGTTFWYKETNQL